MLRARASTLSMLLMLTTACSEPTCIFVARKIVTMDPARPEAVAVAVEDGRIAAVGSLAEVREKLAGRAVELDERFADAVLLPGFIENHLHPIMAALILPMAFATPYDWHLPGREVTGVVGRDNYLARLRSLEGELDDPSEWLFAWGYHADFHGPLSRADLDAISMTRPVIAWHRSFHEIYANSAALSAMAISAADVANDPQVDWENGHFFEKGLEAAIGPLSSQLFSPFRLIDGLETAREVIHRGGITTIADMASGLFDLEKEWWLLWWVFESDDTPFRTLLVPDARSLGAKLGPEEAFARIESLPARNRHRLRFLRQVKLFSDGAFFSQLMQMLPPGYLDGHTGEWIMRPEELESAARPYWKAGYQIHVHVNGDLGVKATLDVLEKLQTERPRADHRFALHHFGFASEAQTRRVAALGAIVSANPYYLYTLGDAYAARGLGPERAAQMVRLGSLARAGVPVSLHSDFTMAPAEPLTLAWVATNRITGTGTRMAPEQRLSVEQALRAITIDAAHAIQMENEIGSITVGKRADFVVLEEDPTSVPPQRLKDIAIRATVFEGTVYPLARPAD